MCLCRRAKDKIVAISQIIGAKMTVKMVSLTLFLGLLGTTSLLASPVPAGSPPSAPSAMPSAPIEFKFHFQEKGIDPQGHGAFVGKATKILTLPNGHVLYDGNVVINPKRADTAMVVSVGPDIVLPSGKKVGQLTFGSYRMMFDTRTESIVYMNGVMILQDGAGRSLDLLYNQIE